MDYIQGLRAFAVLVVALLHYGRGLYLARSGYSGVDLFFVIAGFIMIKTTHRLDGSVASVSDYAIHRLTRIVPPYIVATVVIFYLRPDVPVDWASVVWAIKSICFVPLWNTQPIDPPGWTLPFEIWFYVLIGTALFFKSYRGAMLVTLFFLTLVIYRSAIRDDLLPVYLTNTGVGFGAYVAIITNHLDWNFVVGVCVGWVALANPRIAPWLSKCAILVACMWISLNWVSVIHVPSGLRWGLPYGLLLLGLDRLNVSNAIKIPTFIVKIGDASYSIYLFHWVAYLWAGFYDQHHAITPLMRYEILCVYFAIALSVGFLSYYTMERGFCEMAKRWLLGWRSVNVEEPRAAT